ncbi:MAG: ATP-binding cassette domain-containing protein [Gemmatimonadetes bacterium]|nr:ATP-binding cassette domain-containing protein [Gemmatimonadota bacterium]
MSEGPVNSGALLRAEGIRWTADAGLPGSRDVLRGITLTLHENEACGIVGPSGAGKTTLVTVLAGLLAPDHGDVRFADGTVPGPGDVGLVFQEAERAFFEETVLDDVAFGARNIGLDEPAARERAREALHAVGLDPATFGDRAPETLSGGEARRAAIAGVLVMEPRLVVFDEPPTGLAAAGPERLHDVLRDLRERGVPTLTVSHDLDFVRETCGRVVVLEEGAITWDGPADSLADGLPESWRRNPGDSGGEMALIAAAMVRRGWIGAGDAVTPEALAARWRNG